MVDSTAVATSLLRRFRRSGVCEKARLSVGDEIKFQCLGRLVSTPTHRITSVAYLQAFVQADVTCRLKRDTRAEGKGVPPPLAEQHHMVTVLWSPTRLRELMITLRGSNVDEILAKGCNEA